MRLPILAALAATAALLAAGCGATGHIGASSDAGNGKQLFQAKCASCHTLKDANATGTVGPNLDEAFGCAMQQGFEESTVRDVVRGQIAYASPPMPRKLVAGDEADAVAVYVTQAVQRTPVDCGRSGSGSGSSGG